MSRDISKGVRRFRAFHGYEEDDVAEIEWLADPGSMVILGRAVSITYESDKLNGGGDGEPCLYEHKFHKDDVLVCDESGTMLAIVGPKLKVTHRGIVN